MDLDGSVRTTTGKLEVGSTGGNTSLGGTLMTTLGDIVVRAAHSLLLDSALSSVSTDGGAVTLQADADGNHTGDYVQNLLGSRVNSSGGALAVSGQQIFLTDAFLETEGGSMQLNGADGIDAAGLTTLLTQGGSFAAQADADGNDDGDFNQTGAAGLISSGAGALSLTGKRVNTDGLVRSTTGGITFTSPTSFITVSNKISTEGGKVTLLAANGITLDHADADISTLGGEFFANANTDGNNTGTFLQSDPGSVINTSGSGGGLSITARDMDLQGDLRSGTGEMSLTSTRGSLAASHLLETTGAPMGLFAAHGILLSGATVRTNGGAFSADANSDADDDGDFSHLGAAGVINTAGGALSISGRSVNVGGSLRSGAGQMGVTATFGGITASNDLLTTGGAMNLLARNGILLNGNNVRTEGGALAANANTNGDEEGDFLQTAGGVINTGTGEIALSGYRLDTDGSMDNTAADILLTATGGFARLSGPVTTVGGDVEINAEDDLILDSPDADVRTFGGAFRADANTDGNDDGEFNQSNGSLIDTAGGELTITADDFDLAELRSPGGTVSLLASRPGSEVYLGNAVRVNGQINISDAEADRITADTLVIGGDTAGNIAIGDFSPVGVGTLFLRTGGSVAEEGAGDALLADVVVPSLAIRSVGGVNLDVDVTSLAVRNDGVGAIHVEDMAGGMTVGTVAGITGVSTLGGGITLLTYSPFSVNSPVLDSGGGNITLAALGFSPADDLSVNADVTAAGGNGNIRLAAGDTVSIGPGVRVCAAGDGDVTVASGEDFTDGVFDQDGNSAAGDIRMGAGSEVCSDDGDILMDAARNLLLAVLDANDDGDSDVGDVTTYSRFGTTQDANGAALNITAKNLRMFSYQNIGSKKDPIEVSSGAKINKPPRSSFLVYPHLPKLDPHRYIKTIKE